MHKAPDNHFTTASQGRRPDIEESLLLGREDAEFKTVLLHILRSCNGFFGTLPIIQTVGCTAAKNHNILRADCSPEYMGTTARASEFCTCQVLELNETEAPGVSGVFVLHERNVHQRPILPKMMSAPTRRGEE